MKGEEKSASINRDGDVMSILSLTSDLGKIVFTTARDRESATSIRTDQLSRIEMMRSSSDSRRFIVCSAGLVSNVILSHRYHVL